MKTGQEARPSLLSPYIILDLTDELGFLCGKVLADLGAEVIKVERPGGDASRGMGPFYHNSPHPERNLYWFAYNANKKGVTLNLEAEMGREIFRRLAQKADVLIESYPPGLMESLGLGYESLRTTNPRLVMTSITPFGQKGPHAKYRASDLELMAMGGLMYLVGDPDRPPVRVTLPQSYMWAGMQAAMATLVAIYHRGVTEEGQHVDVSAQASMLWSLMHAPTFWDINRTIPTRAGAYITGRSITGAKVRAVYPCKDGFVAFILYGGPAGQETNRAIIEWMNAEGKAPEALRRRDWSRFNIAAVTQEEVDEIEGAIAVFLRGLTKQEFFRGAVEKKMLGYPLSTPQDVLVDPQLAARGFWQRAPHPELGEELTYPGGFAKFSEAACGVHRRAPTIGEHNEEVYGGLLGISREELVRLKEAGVI